MEQDERILSSEAPRAPALDPEEGMLTPVAGPDTNIRPTSGRYARPHAVRRTRHSAAVRPGAGAQRTCLCATSCRHAASMLRACYECFDRASAGADVDPDFSALTVITVIKTKIFAGLAPHTPPVGLALFACLQGG